MSAGVEQTPRITIKPEHLLERWLVMGQRGWRKFDFVGLTFHSRTLRGTCVEAKNLAHDQSQITVSFKDYKFVVLARTPESVCERITDSERCGCDALKDNTSTLYL